MFGKIMIEKFSYQLIFFFINEKVTALLCKHVKGIFSPQKPDSPQFLDYMEL